MDIRYKHLDGEERGVILAEHRRGASLREIGELLGRARSTIGRELRRGRPDGLPAQPYCAQRGGLAYRARRKPCGRRRKLALGGWLHDFVRDKLIHRRWSPEQIARKLRVMHPEDPTRQISHETIYAAIYAQPRGGLKAEMLAALRQAKPARGLRRTTQSGGSIAPESLRIIHRPEEIEGRLVPGHWEGDLIKGAFNRSAVGTVVERKTRHLILSKMRGCTADAALDGFARQMKRLPAALRKSMTCDRGSEMACHPELARRLKIDIWFCDPHQSAGKQSPGPFPDPPHTWQRGSNENTNGLLRQFFPKGTDLSGISQTELNDVARAMNQRPRKTLGWKTPEEAMAEELAAFKSTVAFET
jgi:IS30 family transposase